MNLSTVLNLRLLFLGDILSVSPNHTELREDANVGFIKETGRIG